MRSFGVFVNKQGYTSMADVECVFVNKQGYTSMADVECVFMNKREYTSMADLEWTSSVFPKFKSG